MSPHSALSPAFERGEIVCAVSRTLLSERGANSEPNVFISAQRRLLADARTGNPLVGYDYAVVPTHSQLVARIPHLSRLLCVVMQPSDDPNHTMVWLLPRCSLHVRISLVGEDPGTTVIALPISQHTRLSHLQRAVYHLYPSAAIHRSVVGFTVTRIVEDTDSPVHLPNMNSDAKDPKKVDSIPVKEVEADVRLYVPYDVGMGDLSVMELLRLDKTMVEKGENTNILHVYVTMHLQKEEEEGLSAASRNLDTGTRTVASKTTPTLSEAIITSVKDQTPLAQCGNDDANQDEVPPFAHEYKTLLAHVPENQLSSISTFVQEETTPPPTIIREAATEPPAPRARAQSASIASRSRQSAPFTYNRTRPTIHLPTSASAEAIFSKAPRAPSAPMVQISPPLGIRGLKNLGNTCYMNSALQCLAQTPPLVAYFLRMAAQQPKTYRPEHRDDVAAPTALQPPVRREPVMMWQAALNPDNPLGSKNASVARALALFLKLMYVAVPGDAGVLRSLRFTGRGSCESGSTSSLSQSRSSSSLCSLYGTDPNTSPFGVVNPVVVKKTVGMFNETFYGLDQQDAQEFLQVLLDAVHEDLKMLVPVVPAVLVEATLSVPEDSRSGEKMTGACDAAEGLTNESSQSEDGKDSVMGELPEPTTTIPNPPKPSPNASRISEIFQGALKSRVECVDCHTSSVKVDPFTLLSLPVTNGEDCDTRGTDIFVCVVSLQQRFTGTRVKVTVLPTWTILELKEHVASLSVHKWEDATRADPQNRVLVYEVLDGHIEHIYRDWEMPIEMAGIGDLGGFDGIYVTEISDSYAVPERVSEDDLVDEEPASSNDLNFIPVYIHVQGLGMRACPLLIAVPSEIEVVAKFCNDILDLCDPDEVKQEKNQHVLGLLGKALYRHIGQRILADQGALWCWKHKDVDLDGVKVWEAGEKRDREAMQQLVVEGLLKKPDYNHIEDYELVECLFSVQFLQGDRDERQIVDKDHFYSEIRSRGRELYPNETEDLILERADESMLRRHGHYVRVTDGVSKVPETRLLHLTGEILLVVTFSPYLFRILFKQTDVLLPRHDSSMHSFFDPPTPLLPPKEYKMDTCLREFLKEELMGANDTWFCPSCKEQKRIKKKLDLQSLPEILIFHLKRFSSSYRGFRSSAMNKIEGLVEFPMTGLDLSSFVVPDATATLEGRTVANTASCDMGISVVKPIAVRATILEKPTGDSAVDLTEASPMSPNHGLDGVLRDGTADGLSTNAGGVKADSNRHIYDLYAVSNHVGGMGGGHYTAFVKSTTDNNWYNMDDVEVSIMDENDVMTSAAYLLFYKRRDVEVKESLEASVRQLRSVQTQLDRQYEQDLKDHEEYRILASAARPAVTTKSAETPDSPVLSPGSKSGNDFNKIAFQSVPMQSFLPKNTSTPGVRSASVSSSHKRPKRSDSADGLSDRGSTAPSTVARNSRTGSSRTSGATSPRNQVAASLEIPICIPPPTLALCDRDGTSNPGETCSEVGGIAMSGRLSDSCVSGLGEMDLDRQSKLAFGSTANSVGEDSDGTVGDVSFNYGKRSRTTSG